MVVGYKIDYEESIHRSGNGELVYSQWYINITTVENKAIR